MSQPAPAPSAEAAAAPRPRGRAPVDPRVTAGRFLIAALGILAWWGASHVMFVVPTPLASLRAVLAGGMGTDAVYTARAVVVALLLSVVFGLALGVPLGLLPFLRRSYEPLVLAANATPKLILFPLVLAVFKIGFAANVTLGVIHGMFPVILNVSSALKQLPPVYRKVARVSGASFWQTLTKVYVPAMLLPLATSVRLGFGLSMIGVVLAEIFASKYGMGRVIMHSYTLSRYPEMAGALATLYLGGMLGSWLIWRCERWLGKAR